MRSKIQILTFWTGLFLNVVLGSNHCMEGGITCPKDASGIHMHCGYYLLQNVNLHATMNTNDFMSLAQNICINDSDCNVLRVSD